MTKKITVNQLSNQHQYELRTFTTDHLDLTGPYLGGDMGCETYASFKIPDRLLVNEKWLYGLIAKLERVEGELYELKRDSRK